MASKALKGLTIKIGGDTSELNKALDKVDKQSRNLSSELGQINKLLKMDPSNTELLAQKQKVLADAISNTEERLDTLKEAEKQAQEQFQKGEVSEEQYRALQREIIATEKKLDGYKNAAKETADAVEQLGKEAGDAAGELDEQADKSRDAEDAAEDLDDASSELASGGLKAMAAAAAAAVTAIVALAEESREYRTEMAKLDTAFVNVGHSSEAATKTYEALQSVVGETEQAVEAANHLAKLCTTEEELADWTEILTGVYGTFGASLSIESLAEAANETARAGQVTGAFADSLNWAAKEGETFGVALMENIDFTELSAKELDKLTDAQREEYEARKAQYDEIEAYNASVEEAATAEDLFNIALQKCTTQQERQQLITKTLTNLYGSAATQYKKTNAEVIRSNQATEKWNKTTAKIGKTVEPVVTDLKELGVSLLEDVEGPLEDIADFIRHDVIPAIKSVSSWVKKNGPVIEATIAGITTAFIAFKAATIANTIAQKGFAASLKATAVAQKALNLVQKASPWGLVAAGVTAVVTAVVAYNAATKDAKKPVEVLTEEERKLIEASREAAEAFKEQQQAMDEALGNVAAEYDHTKELAEELFTLADASGKVQEKDQARAEFILGELNEALGTEYSMVDGVIQKYDELRTNIEQVIAAKRAQALVDAYNEQYAAAIQQEAEAFEAMNLAQEDYLAAKDRATEKLNASQAAHDEYIRVLQEEGVQAAEFAWQNWIKADEAFQKENEVVLKKKGIYDESLLNYQNYYNTVANFEEAQTAALEGNYKLVEDILVKKGATYGTYSAKVDTETARVLDTLRKEAIDAGLEAQRTKSNFENGVEGYTEEMVKEAETNYEEAMDEFANAYADAESVGEDLSEGMTAGAENKRSGLLAKARSLVSGFLSAARKEADSHSPSRKAIKLFEDIGAGAEIGVDNKTEDVKRAATDQAAAVLDAYREQEVTAQKALRNVADSQASRQTASRMTAATANSGLLESILAAIEKGQVLTIDGDTLVGATADKMDNALGGRRVLSARGAI